MYYILEIRCLLTKELCKLQRPKQLIVRYSWIKINIGIYECVFISKHKGSLRALHALLHSFAIILVVSLGIQLQGR